MKKSFLLNAELSHLIARLGHTDGLTLCDAGLPIPADPQRIDLAVSAGVPSFMQVMSAITHEMQVEAVLMAEEFISVNPQLHAQVVDHLIQLGVQQGNTIRIEYVPHEAFKVRTRSSRGVVRSGECTAYANVIFYSGVVF
ncbi:MAG: D-ribose pyranase [Plesiomonas sp.]|uniref:D-ribose pyranase n=2 Tax=Plesiomonas sp. TaxID=2486279 RepID=UPI003F3CE6D7